MERYSALYGRAVLQHWRQQQALRRCFRGGGKGRGHIKVWLQYLLQKNALRELYRRKMPPARRAFHLHFHPLHQALPVEYVFARW